MTSTGGLGPAWLPPMREELIAKCPWHGHSPYNDLAKTMIGSGELRDTRQDAQTD
jgi:hypothetical protein